MRLPPLTLIIGGASSGKSAFAEKLVLQSGLAKVYVATAEAHDDEMKAKIASHRARRIGHGWRTVEAPLDLENALAQTEPGEIVLVDCVTFWLTNQMLDGADLQEEADVLFDVLDQMSQPVVMVTNDVSGGIVPENAMARAFRNAQGRLNQRLAAEADLVVLITAGLPMILKGEAPAVSGTATWDDPDDADDFAFSHRSGSLLW
ncbi:bifunctional adenosylcobinamide kinase/adenosylcobinamide-phosphate guanylyltransferase [Roseicyclus sediminis]|uniref:bifunctional adenosylcobinamide kinase/adenosylcobinamide-phosphate guanylyltransferase n=1 Tax=Roseicyclus sediminis TaxID=2980997 RepID=UPI00292A54FC|nr:bifunctional adenosylcobinamide kinase/adenosylcobinamide-phosphate guanylyltransferase [Roseibacterium sp. SDUM158016]